MAELKNINSLDRQTLIKSDPILFFLNRKLNFGPLEVGILFIFLAVIMIPWAIQTDVWSPKEGLYSLKSSYHTWLGDILLGITNALILWYYLSIPKLLRRVFHSKVIEDNKGSFEELYFTYFNKKINIKRQLFLLLVALIVTTIMQWMWVKDGLYGWTETSKFGNISLLGWYHFIYFAIEFFIILNFLVSTFLTISFFRGIEKNVRTGKLKFNFVRLCQYDSGGLKPLNDIAMNILKVFFTIGIYTALIVYSIIVEHPDLTKMYIWQISELSSLLIYLVVAPTIYFLVLTPIHRIMKRKKNSLYKLLREKDKEIAILEMDSMSKVFKDVELFERVKFNDELFNLIRKLPSWPFNLKSIMKLVSLTTIPLIPIIFELLIHKMF